MTSPEASFEQTQAAYPNSPPASSHGTSNGTAEGVRRATKVKRVARRSFCASFTFATSLAMAESLARCCRPGAPLSQSSLLRLALHEKLLQLDPSYATQWQRGA